MRPVGVRYVREGQIARCPWHNWEFDITTGVNLADPQKRVRTYEVDVTDGQVYLTAPVSEACERIMNTECAGGACEVGA